MIKAQPKTIRIAEQGLILFVWGVILVTPLLFGDDNRNPTWKILLRQFETIIPLAIAFLVNRFVLVPQLLFKKKPVVFLASVFGLITFLTIASYVVLVETKLLPANNKPPRADNRPPRQEPPPEGQTPWKDFRNQQGRQPKPVPPYANFLILSILLVGFDTGLKAILRWNEVEQEKVNLEKENVASQLTALRNQVSPHFFMNTLNNIHALVDIDKEEAKEAIIKLSKMMRYQLYETESEQTTLKKEIGFLISYIDLMKLRFSDQVTITLSLPEFIPDKILPPFLFAPLIENAFKHGISYKNSSFIHINLIVGRETLIFLVRNSKGNEHKREEHAGIGISNIKKRLDLLYGSRYHLELIENREDFTVSLTIPL